MFGKRGTVRRIEVWLLLRLIIHRFRCSQMERYPSPYCRKEECYRHAPLSMCFSHRRDPSEGDWEYTFGTLNSRKSPDFGLGEC